MNLRFQICKIISIVVVLILLNSILFLLSLEIDQNVEASSTREQVSDREFSKGTFSNTLLVGSENESEVCLDLNFDYKYLGKNPPDSKLYRYEHGFTSVWGTDSAVLFGGRRFFSPDFLYFGDTWIYYLNNKTFAERKPVSPPSGRSGFGMATIWGTDNTIIFGGENETGTFNETWLYDFGDNKWTLLAPTSYPSKRIGCSLATIYGTDKVLLFGGSTGGNETWIFDYSDKNWKRQLPDKFPSSRKNLGLSMIFGTDKVLLFGGSVGRAQTWIYDFSMNNWTKMTPQSSIPTGRQNHVMTYIYGTDHVLISGGDDGGDYTDDTWIYNFKGNNWTEITVGSFVPSNAAITSFWGHPRAYALSGKVPWNLIVWASECHFNASVYDSGYFTSKPLNAKGIYEYDNAAWQSSVPIGSTLKFQLRSADSETALSSKNFVGPDGAQSSYYTASASKIWTGHNGDTWIQYKAHFYSALGDSTPSLKQVNINYESGVPPKAELHNPVYNSIINTNTPEFSWEVNHIFTNTPKFQLVIDDNIDFDSIDYDSGEQFSSTHQWQFPTGTKYSAIQDGTWYWKVHTKDMGNIWSPYSDVGIFKIDTGKPESEITYPIDNSYNLDLEKISGTAFDDSGGTGLDTIEISITRVKDNFTWDGSAWSDNKNWLTAHGRSTWSYNTYSIKWTSGWGYNIQSRAIDNATNVELQVCECYFTIDSIRPESSIYYPIDKSYNNGLESISGAASDINGSGIESVDISLKRKADDHYWTGTEWNSDKVWLQTEGTSMWEYDLSNVMLNSYYEYQIKSRAMDILGNLEVPSAGITFIYDDIPPENSSILINNDAIYTNSTEVALSIYAEDKGAGLGRMSFNNDNNQWTDWENYGVTKNFELIIGDGKKFVYLRVKDNANNTASSISDSIILDMTPPRDVKLEINGAEEVTNSTSVILTLSAFDDISGLDKMALSNDGITWSDWEGYNRTISYNLTPGDGLKKIFFKINDKAGNIAEIAEATIELNTTTPDDEPNGKDPGNGGPDTPDDTKKDKSEKEGASTPLIISALIVIIIIIIVVILFILRRKKSGPPVYEPEVVEERLETSEQLPPQPSSDTQTEIAAEPTAEAAEQLPPSPAPQEIGEPIPETVSEEKAPVEESESEDLFKDTGSDESLEETRISKEEQAAQPTEPTSEIKVDGPHKAKEKVLELSDLQITQIEKLGELKEQGLITEEEFDIKKKELLGF
jgi:hypothetical protein